MNASNTSAPRRISRTGIFSMALPLTCMLLLASGCETASDTNTTSVDRDGTYTTTTHSTADRDGDVSVTANRPIGQDNTVDRDNTAVNERDADGHTLTPFDQSNEQDDIDLVAEIRSAVVELDDLSIIGQNVKIITNNGRVVLRGPVDTAAERAAIEATATEIAGAGNVVNELEVEDDGEPVGESNVDESNDGENDGEVVTETTTETVTETVDETVDENN